MTLTNSESELSSATRVLVTEFGLAADCGANVVTILDGDYPARLHELNNPPPILFYQGLLIPASTHNDSPIEEVTAVAVVGSRNASHQGKELAEEIGYELACNQITVVSGLAKGIDTAAHVGALQAAGRTIAVLGTGITECYPPENKDLAMEIAAQNGLLISQFWPSQQPAKWTFPQRNALQTVLSDAVVVVEAADRSGTQITAKFAVDQNRQLYIHEPVVESTQWGSEYYTKGLCAKFTTPNGLLESLQSQIALNVNQQNTIVAHG